MLLKKLLFSMYEGGMQRVLACATKSFGYILMGHNIIMKIFDGRITLFLISPLLIFILILFDKREIWVEDC